MPQALALRLGAFLPAHVASAMMLKLLRPLSVIAQHLPRRQLYLDQNHPNPRSSTAIPSPPMPKITVGNMSRSKQQVTFSWNPEEVLSMVNPKKFSATQWTCPALTTRKTRCLQSRDADSYIGAGLVLNEMSIKDPATFLDNKDKLKELAELTLCLGSHRHKYTTIPGRKEKVSCVELTVAEWVALISEYVAQQNKRRETQVASSDTLDSSSVCTPGGRLTPAPSVSKEASSASSTQHTNQRRARTEARSVPIKLDSIKLESSEIDFSRVPQSCPAGRQHRRQRPPRPASATIDASKPPVDQPPMAVDIQAFANLTLENNRLKSENSQLRKEYEAMKQQLVAAERDCKAMEKDKDDLGAQVDGLYQEINDLTRDRVGKLFPSVL